jgi:hypothetical protein
MYGRGILSVENYKRVRFDEVVESEFQCGNRGEMFASAIPTLDGNRQSAGAEGETT